jgi:iron complex transport system permease protein
MKLIPFLLRLGLLFLLTAAANAQNFQGTVLDSLDRPLPSARVVWLLSQGGIGGGHYTDSLGRFSFALKSQPESVRVIVSAPNYFADTVLLQSGIPYPVRLQAKTLNAYELVVESFSTSLYTAKPQFIENIGSRELRRSACCNLSESFETNATVDVGYTDAVTGAKTIQLLGLDGRYVSVTTEQLPSIRGLASAYGIGYIPGPWMESIQISKGSGSAANGFESMDDSIRQKSASFMTFGIQGKVALLVIVATATIAVILRLVLGARGWSWPTLEIADLRVGAIVSATVAGASLGLSGVLLQARLRKPLASPFVLGLSSGAGLSVSIAALVASSGAAWVIADGGMVAASVGSAVALVVVVAAGRRHGAIEPVTLLLAGVVVASVAGALTVLVQYLMPPSSRGDLMAWSMGRIPELPERVPLVVGGVLLVSIGCWSFLRARWLDAACTADDEASSLGVDLPALRWRLVVLSGALAGSSVVLCGPIAFVGFVAPHVARLMLGAGHRGLVVASPILGAALLIAADALRLAVPLPGAGKLPVAVVTAILGGPIFLWVLRRQGGRGS